MKVVPLPISLDANSLPPCFSMMFCEIDRPKPVPLPGSLVVKNGSNIFNRSLGAIPCPVSLTITLIPPSMVEVEMAIVPFSGMACDALIRRFRMTCEKPPAKP